MKRRKLASLTVFAWFVLALLPLAAAGRPVLRVAYAGSMGALMDRGLGPAFEQAHAATFQGTGQGSYALARLLAAKQLQADVFIAVTPGPVDVLRKAGLIASVEPIASTRMVVIYSPRSRFAPAFAAAATGGQPWHAVLAQPGLRFGRSDPSIDPQGANVLFTLQLAARYYRQPQLVRRIAGDIINPRQIFTENSLLSRLEAGQIDATIGYASAAHSHHLPTLALPDAINLGNPAMRADWYAKAGIELPDGKVLRAQPLVFYAAILKTARQPQLARQFIAFIHGPRGQALLRQYGYAPATPGAP